MDVDVDKLQITLYKSALRAAPDDLPQVFPLGMLPAAHIRFKYDWQLPMGRSALDHYGYPVVAEADDSIRLQPPDIVGLFRGEAYEFSILADLQTEVKDSGNDDRETGVAQGELPLVILGKTKSSGI